jgi:hypothetical protein
MDIADMAKRAPHSRVIGPARLPRHRFIIMKEGYASVVRDARFAVHGLLWDLAFADLRPLDRFEGIDRGLYIKLNQPVIVPEGSKRALVYVGGSSEPGKPRPGYMESILAAAEALDLPPAYRKELSGWMGRPVAGRGASDKAVADTPAMGPVQGVTPRAAHPDTMARPSEVTPGKAGDKTPGWDWNG